MFGFISAREQLVKERQKNAAMQAQGRAILPSSQRSDTL